MVTEPTQAEISATSRGGQNSSSEELRQIVSFRVGSEEFGLDILRVQEIIRHQHLTRVPNAPDFVEGVINLRGQVVPVIALRKRFGLERQAHDNQSRIVVLEVQNMIVGFVVDSVPEVLSIPASAVAPPPRFSEVEREYVSGVAKLEDRLLILLDVDRILGDPEGGVAARA
jgi:purine-binding chemotaxis protein CheW